MKFRDLLNKKINSANHQISFDIRKRKLKELDISIDDLMDTEITNTLKKFKKGGF